MIHRVTSTFRDPPVPDLAGMVILILSSHSQPVPLLGSWLSEVGELLIAAPEWEGPDT